MNTRFAVAVHILTFLQSRPNEPASSDLIAGSVGTNPSLIRRMLSQLASAGLTTSQLGSGGGALLARPAKTITLADVYRVVAGDAEVIPIHDTPNPKCEVGRNIHFVLEDHIEDAERAMYAELERTTIADLGAEVVRRERERARKNRAS
jgi:Rrf2 family protein